MSNYIELTFIVEPREQGNDVLIAQLSEIGFESFVENDTGFEAYIQEKEFHNNQLIDCLAPYSAIFKFDYTTKLIPQQNWNKEWETNFQPIEVANKCYIRAPFHPSKENFIYDVIIEPKMSFGTGHHYTTQLMVEKLMTLEIKDKSLLDMGCGTGILAILASKMEANPITAIDIDEWSYENTLENLPRNDINNVNVYKGNAEILAGKYFHTILANINKNILLSDLETYNNSLEKNGNLIISGFFETDVIELTNKANEFDLILEDKKVNNQWTMLHFSK